MVATLQIHNRFGYIGAFGAVIDNIVAEALKKWSPESPIPKKGDYHVTLVPKAELPDLPKSFDLRDFSKLLEKSAAQIQPIGIGGLPKDGKKGPVLFVVVIWNAAQRARKALGLPPKQFHVTLTKHDKHTIDKGLDSLLPGQFPADPSIELLDHLIFSLQLDGAYEKALDFAARAGARYPTSPKGFVRLGDLAVKRGSWKLAMLSFGRVLHLGLEDAGLEEYCTKRLKLCAAQTEWGQLFSEDEIGQIPSECRSALLEGWGDKARGIVSGIWTDDSRPTLVTEGRNRLRMPPTAPNTEWFELPRFFSWVVPFKLAVMSTPRHAQDVEALSSSAIGIRHIITLTEETPLPASWFSGTGVKNTFVAVKNMHPPSLEQLDLILRLCESEENLPALIHCGGGKGRAGTVAACYLAAYGFSEPSPGRQDPAMSASQAITALRAVRPGSLETQRQEDFVHQWVSAVWKRRAVLPALVSEPAPCAPEITGKFNASADLVVLVGLPGSGKSSFAGRLMVRNDLWRRISQDDAGPGAGRSACEADIGRKGTAKVILDRCNPSSEDRKYWLSLACNWANNPVAVVFDYPADLCISRAQQRPDHPTLPPGNRVRAAVTATAKQLQMPSLAEGFVGIAIVRSFEAAEDVIRRLSPAGLFKFPRTPHLLNLGAATDDDLHAAISPSLSAAFNHAVITEKIDGANMGISLDAQRSIVVQNRSHFVNSASHEQFKKLDLWIERNREGLYAILDRDPTFSERYILFGEWLAATHSIQYTQLPDLFIAFDLYDRRTRSYARYADLLALASNNGINIVPLLWEGAESDLPDLRSMVQTPSKFYEGPVEGVYVKIEGARENKVLRRGKVVRGDFISGNDHWTKGILKWNTVLAQTDDEG